MLEKNITRPIMKRAREMGAIVIKTHGGPMQIKGLPDLLLCYKGRFVGIEVKVPGEDATPLQAAMLQDIAAAGGIVGVAHSVAEAVAILSQVP